MNTLLIRALLSLWLAATAGPSSANPGALGTPDAYARLEGELVQEHNRLRTDPGGYAFHVETLRSWFDAENPQLMRVPGRIPILTVEGPRAADEAIEALRALDPLTSLEASRGMGLGARDHANDQRSGGTGHDGRDGSQPWDRVSRYGSWSGTIGENIAYGDYGEDDARLVLLSLVVDDGVPSRGHRDNIVNPAFNVIGAACGPHEEWGTVCVITYAGGFIEGR